jgi:uncharacterized protein (DUF1778 family)
MSKTITLRLDDAEYELIATGAMAERRPISNFITATVIREIEQSIYADGVEMAQIKGDQGLLDRLNQGHTEAKARRGKRLG